MIKKLSRIVGLEVSNDIAGIIAETCCDTPYWMRKACSYIHNKIEIQARPTNLIGDQVKLYLDEFVKFEGISIAETPIRHLFRVYPELIVHCKSIMNGNISNVPHTYVNVLNKYGVLRLLNGKYELSGTLLNECLTSIFSDDTILTSASTEPIGDEEKGLIDKWADELANIGRRRNIIERRLREIVLNFIRIDSLGDKSKPKPKERIMKKLAEQRRHELDRFSVDDIMYKLFWNELIVLIDKEWTLFERVLADKKELKLNATIVSERYDAHAKDFDEADMALYRRSLKWFEDRLDTID